MIFFFFFFKPSLNISCHCSVSFHSITRSMGSRFNAISQIARDSKTVFHLDKCSLVSSSPDLCLLRCLALSCEWL